MGSSEGMVLRVISTQMTRSYIFFPTAVDAVVSLEHCLGAVLQWKQENGLRLKPDKMEILRVGTPPALLGGNSHHKERGPQLGGPS